MRRYSIVVGILGAFLIAVSRHPVGLNSDLRLLLGLAGVALTFLYLISWYKNYYKKL